METVKHPQNIKFMESQYRQYLVLLVSTKIRYAVLLKQLIIIFLSQTLFPEKKTTRVRLSDYCGEIMVWIGLHI